MISEVIISKLLNNYKDQKKNESSFIDAQSVHWDHYFKENDKFYNSENLINFRKNLILSQGLDDSTNLQNILNLFEVLKYFDSNYLKKNLPEKNIGNCEHAVNFLGYYFDYGIIHHLKWYEEVQKYIQDEFNVLEIGGGFGSFARIILNNKNIKYFSIDLPEANLMSNYYLQSHFPKKKIFNYSDLKTNSVSKVINDYDIFILPPRILENEKIKFDFIINTRSFMEMNKKIIKEYFNFIQKKINQNGYFLNINKYLKSTVKEDIKFEEYPYDENWKVEISKKSFLQPNIHFLLTKRQSNKGDIGNELLSIKHCLKKKNEIKMMSLFRRYVKKIIWLIGKKILIFLFSKKILKKISNVIYNISEDKKD